MPSPRRSTPVTPSTAPDCRPAQDTAGFGIAAKNTPRSSKAEKLAWPGVTNCGSRLAKNTAIFGLPEIADQPLTQGDGRRQPEGWLNDADRGSLRRRYGLAQRLDAEIDEIDGACIFDGEEQRLGSDENRDDSRTRRDSPDGLAGRYFRAR